MIHAPTVLAAEVLPDRPAVQRRDWTHVFVTGRVSIVVMHAE
jgi:hypothetical protein